MRFLVTIYRPAGYDPSMEGKDMAREIDALNDRMVAAGVRVFVGGLTSPESARSVQSSPDGTLRTREGLYLETPEHVGGLWVLEVADMEAALTWATQAAEACQASVEVRPFH